MPIFAIHLIGNSKRLRGAIQDYYGPFVPICNNAASYNMKLCNQPRNVSLNLKQTGIQSILVISKSNGPSETP